MRRREFITLLSSGAVGTWPLAARAQQAERQRRIGVLINFRTSDPEGQARVTAFRQTPRELVGQMETASAWTPGGWGRCRTISPIRRGTGGAGAGCHPCRVQPECGGAATGCSQRADCLCVCCRPSWCRVFTTLARPGGNTTGFTAFEYSISRKWLELLKEIAPTLARIAVIRYLASPPASANLPRSSPRLSSSLAELSSIDTRDASEMESALNIFAHEPNGGLIETASATGTTHREIDNFACDALPPANYLSIPLLRLARWPRLLRA